MTYVLPDLAGGSGSYQLESGSKLVNDSDGVVKITNAAGALGTLMLADAVTSTSPVTKAQLDALVDGAPALLDTLNELAAALGDDEDYASTMSALHAAISQKVTDFLAAIGISANTTNMGAFTDATIPDGVNLRAVLQAIGTAVDLRATLADPAFTGTLQNTDFYSNGAHMKLRTSTNDFIFKTYDTVESLQFSSNTSSKRLTMTPHGGHADAYIKIIGDTKLDSADVTGDIVVAGTVDGRNVANDGAKVDNLVTRYKNVVFGDAGSAADLADIIASGSNVLRLQVRVNTAYDDSAVLKIGKTGTDDYFATVSAVNLSTVGVYEFAIARRLGADTQATFTITQSPTQGDADIFLSPSA